MVVGTCKIALALHGNRSLKGKRRIVSSLKQKIKSRFNVSIAEVDDLDLHGRAVLGVAVAAVETSHADSQIQSVVQFICQHADVTDVAVEFQHR